MGIERSCRNRGGATQDVNNWAWKNRSSGQKCLDPSTWGAVGQLGQESIGVRIGKGREGAGGGIGPIPPMPNMSSGPGASPGGKAASDRARIAGGTAYTHTGLEDTMNKAAAIMKLRQHRGDR